MIPVGPIPGWLPVSPVFVRGMSVEDLPPQWGPSIPSLYDPVSGMICAPPALARAFATLGPGRALKLLAALSEYDDGGLGCLADLEAVAGAAIADQHLKLLVEIYSGV